MGDRSTEAGDAQREEDQEYLKQRAFISAFVAAAVSG
jgi:hypothetical protein